MQKKSVTVLLAALMCGAAIAAEIFQPETKIAPIGLKEVVPVEFGDWKELKEAGPVVNPEVDKLLRKIYVETLTRTYVNRSGDRIMLSMAYGSDQRGVLQAHRPEVCYVAQGFKLATISDGALPTAFGDIGVRRLTTSMGPRHEPVTYWLTMADHVVRNDFDKRKVQLRLLVTGQIPDGLLFRVSSIDRDAGHAFEVQQQFAADMMAAVPTEIRRRLSGLKPAGAT